MLWATVVGRDHNALFNLMRATERLGIVTRFPHHSHLYRIVVDKTWWSGDTWHIMQHNPSHAARHVAWRGARVATALPMTRGMNAQQTLGTIVDPIDCACANGSARLSSSVRIVTAIFSIGLALLYIAVHIRTVQLNTQISFSTGRGSSVRHSRGTRQHCARHRGKSAQSAHGTFKRAAFTQNSDDLWPQHAACITQPFQPFPLPLLLSCGRPQRCAAVTAVCRSFTPPP